MKWIVIALMSSVSCLLAQGWIFPGFSGDPFWGGQIDIEEDREHKAVVSYVSDPVQVGNSALRIDWGVTHSQSWGGSTSLRHFHMDSMAVYNLSSYDSLIFWYYNLEPSSLPGKVHLRFNLCDVSDSPDGANTYNVAETEYWYSFNYILDDEPGWKRIAIPLVDYRQDPNGKGFNRTGWYGIAGNDQLDLDMIKGFQLEFSISATQGDVAFGSIVLDELMLVSEGWSSVLRLPIEHVSNFELFQNYPNPFNSSTVIRFSLPQAGAIRVVVYDVNGREIKRLIDGHLSAGAYSIPFVADGLSSGVYFCVIEGEGFSQKTKMVLLK